MKRQDSLSECKDKLLASYEDNEDIKISDLMTYFKKVEKRSCSWSDT